MFQPSRTALVALTLVGALTGISGCTRELAVQGLMLLTNQAIRAQQRQQEEQERQRREAALRAEYDRKLERLRNEMSQRDSIKQQARSSNEFEP